MALYEQIRDREAAGNTPVYAPDGPLLRLPAPLTSLVGRQADLQSLGGLITHSRLITLTGPGGCGKTRLAVEAASAARKLFADGICMVDLASLADSAQLIQAVASALGQSS